jgi:uncharacterized membrane protein
MNRIILGGALGALAMYFLDPQNGRRRRARTRHRMVHAAKVVNEAGKVTARDTAQRAYGLVASTRRLFGHEDVPDEVLVERVRAELGRVVSHPHAIEVTASCGYITLSGPVLAYEARPLVRRVRYTPGVRGVSDSLTVYEQPDHVPALQGGTPRQGDKFELLQDNWSPAARLLTGALGAGMMLYAARSRAFFGTVIGAAGGGLLARAATNVDLRSLVGLGERGITVQKTISVHAPVEQVFAFWRDVQNFPHFMHNVREVRKIADNRSAWTVAGPGGIPVHWTAEVTRVVPPSMIEWRSTLASVVRHEGRVRFEPSGDGGTRVNVQLRYAPPAGAFGHAVARIFGADPKSEMDADLLRMKTMIETGHPSHDAAQPVSRSARES